MGRNDNGGVGITPKDLKKLAKEKGVKNITSISAEEYRAIHAKKVGGKPKPMKRISAAEFREMQLAGKAPSIKKASTFHFSYNVECIELGYKITLTGRHRSDNELNGKPFKFWLQYKKAIKTAVDEFLLLNRKKLPFSLIDGMAEIDVTVFGPTVRDHENDNRTLKVIQDTLSQKHVDRYGSGISVIIDDDPKHLIPAPHSPRREKGEIWKVEVLIYQKKISLS